MLLLDRNIKIFRLSQVSGNRSSYTTLTTSLEATQQPLSDSKTAMYGGSFGKMYKVYIDVGKDVREGDRIRDYEGGIYEIVAGGIENRTDGFGTDYMGIVIQKIN